MYFVRYPRGALYLRYPSKFSKNISWPKKGVYGDADCDLERKKIRDWVITELDMIFITYGNPAPKSVKQIEATMYEIIGNKIGQDFQVEYAALARRLLLTFLEMARAQQASELAGTASAGWSYDGDPPRTPFDARSFSIPSTPSTTACQAQSGSPEGAGTSHKADERVAYPGPPSVIVKRGTATSSSAALDQIDHGTVSLSCIQPSVASIETDPGSPQRKKIRVDVDSEDDPDFMASTPAEGAEVIARIASQGEGASSALMPSADSYQANMVFLVPQGYRVKKVDVVLTPGSISGRMSAGDDSSSCHD